MCSNLYGRIVGFDRIFQENLCHLVVVVVMEEKKEEDGWMCYRNKKAQEDDDDDEEEGEKGRQLNNLHT